MRRSFTVEGERKLAEILSAFGEGHASLLPVLLLAQEEFGCLDAAAQGCVAERLGVPLSKVRELVTFHSRLREVPCGRPHVQVCRSPGCRMMGSGDVISRIRRDETVAVEEVECLGACDRAPAALVDGEIRGPLDWKKLERILSTGMGT